MNNHDDSFLSIILFMLWIAVIMFGAYAGGTHEGKIKELEKRGLNHATPHQLRPARRFPVRAVDLAGVRVDAARALRAAVINQPPTAPK